MAAYTVTSYADVAAEAERSQQNTGFLNSFYIMGYVSKKEFDNILMAMSGRFSLDCAYVQV